MTGTCFIGGRIIDEVFHPDFMTQSQSRREAERLLAITQAADQGYFDKYEPGTTLAPCEFDVMIGVRNDDGTVEVMVA